MLMWHRHTELQQSIFLLWFNCMQKQKDPSGQFLLFSHPGVGSAHGAMPQVGANGGFVSSSTHSSYVPFPPWSCLGISLMPNTDGAAADGAFWGWRTWPQPAAILALCLEKASRASLLLRNKLFRRTIWNICHWGKRAIKNSKLSRG